MEELQTWLSEAGHKDCPRLSQNSEALSEQWIQRVNQCLTGHQSAKARKQAEVVATEASSEESSASWKSKRPKNWNHMEPVLVDPQLLVSNLFDGSDLNPVTAAKSVQFDQVMDEANFNLFQRVMFIRQGHSIPIGHRGTVIGLNRTCE
ncbi:hypothetical protein Ciccas_005627 [Cichlidogyrus casuarinus]|uniref:5'-3' exoribonuclease 1 SH3-like domain-containing protein n=1 Tax=Cichlidogyrus casuarinus TaxID=1844966 RepID=A0ABD2Q840_9PLAT